MYISLLLSYLRLGVATCVFLLDIPSKCLPLIFKWSYKIYTAVHYDIYVSG